MCDLKISIPITRLMVKQIFFQDFYLEDLTTHKRVLTLYNPYDQDITFKGKKTKHLSWTNLSWQVKPWAEFSTLEVAACHATHLLHIIAIRSNLELKTRPKQFLGSLLLEIELPHLYCKVVPVGSSISSLLCLLNL